MATSAGEVEVKLTLNADDFKRMMGESQKGVQDFTSVLGGVGTALIAAFSFDKIAEFFKDSLSAYAASQLAVTRLVASLGSHGIASEQLVDHLENQSRALEALTGVEQKSITNAQTLLVAFGLQGPVLDRATKATLDLSVGMGMDLEHAAMLVAKAFEGNTTMLKRYGITVDQTVDSAHKFESILAQIENRFGAVAAAQAGTFTGQINALSNSFTHLEEAIGKLMSGPAGGIVSWMKSLVDSMTTAVNFLNKIYEVSGSLGAVLQGVVIVSVQALFTHLINILELIVSIDSHIPLIGNLFTALKAKIDIVKLAVSALGTVERDNFVKSVSNHQVILANETEKQAAYQNTAQKHMDVTTAMNNWILAQNLLAKDAFLKHLDEEYAGYTEFAQSFMTTEKEMWDFAKSESGTFFSGFGDGVAKMIIEGKSFTDSMKAVFQSMAEQIISYIVQMIAKLLVLFALEQATGVGTGVAAGGMFSGAMADGGMIGEPSIITGLRSGRSILAGESGPEMVVPMSGGNQTASEMGGMPGGGGGNGGAITINISGQFLEADSNSWNRLMREQIIPQLRRFAMTSPNSLVTRTRGVV